MSLYINMYVWFIICLYDLNVSDTTTTSICCTVGEVLNRHDISISTLELFRYMGYKLVVI